MTTEFKVGDRVRQIGDDYWRGMEGVYDGRRKGEYDDNLWDYFIPDEDAKYADGSSAHRMAGKSCGMGLNSFELVKPEYPTEIVDRAMALVRGVADDCGLNWAREARAILADLEPVSVDADLIIARQIAADQVEGGNVPDYVSGEFDDHWCIRSIRAAIAKGRQMQKDEQ